ncbi:hypothetical protein PVK62_14735 [Aliivibrio sp. S3MY1]|uniref:DUF6701 domain-containing protein n=1 Tax=unclassified Aliivibrio TaxID=2645654 RepID=UPI002379D0CA|nr:MULTISPECIES: DUF6701 domain-containing protein [unclassified Aliivibrio]MDD9197081.1 hypothetical protein [Aliivibrio sp. S3MY1]MDD9200199.1 hypothetical protein [Aliivibrio sp. S2MY1]
MKRYQSVGLIFLLTWSTLLFSAEKPSFMDKNTTLSTSVCDLFPNTAQSWQGNTNNFFLSNLGGPSTSFIGNTENNSVGFDNLVINEFSNDLYTPENQKRSSRCNDQGTTCLLNGEFARPYTESFTVPSGISRKFNYITQGRDKVFNKPTYFNSTYGAPYYGLFVNNNTILTFTSGEYWFDSINIMIDGEIHIDGDVTFHIKDELWVGGKVLQKENSSLMIFSYREGGCPKPKYLPDYIPDIYWAPFNDYQRINLDKGAIIEGHIYSQGPVQLSNNAQLIGSLTACQLKMSNKAQIIGKPLQICDPSKDYTLKVTPKMDYSLTCERIPVTFTVEDDNGPVSGFNESFSALINAKNHGAACWSTSADKSVPADCSITGSTFIDGEKTLYLDSADLDVFDVTASSDDLNETEKEHFEFVPFKFDIDTVQVIANKSQNFDINVLACNEGSAYVVQDYNGSKKLDVSSYTLDSPNPSEGVRTDLELAGKINPSQIDLTFNQGIATTSLIYQEAGSAHFTLSDPTFTCPSGYDCNDYPVDSGVLSADVNIEARPWKLEICSDVTMDGNSSGGSALVAAGDVFSLKVKPVRYGSEADACQLPVTQNFFKPSAPQALITALAPTLDTPPSSIGGLLGTLSPLLSFANDSYVGSHSTSHYLFENMTYDDVGSIQFNLEASSVGFYDDIQGGIPDGSRSVGRFYPAYFEITDTIWDYPEKQGSESGRYIYMGQNFTDVSFEVTAYNSSGVETENYGLFSNGLKASFSLVDLSSGEHSERLNITDADLEASYWGNGALWKVTGLGDAITWKKKQVTDGASPLLTKEDGPFNMDGNSNSVTTVLGLKINGVDPVSFNATPVVPVVTEQELLSQPEVRYGRMVLDSVGTAVGKTVTVPLRVEYWSGKSFVLSDTDDASKFEGEKHCKQTVWPDPIQSSDTILKGSNAVVQGADVTHLVADANNSTLREQVRFWLRLASSSPQTSEANVNCESGYIEQPWLQYNWRGQGDEDPSTVVTFGIYRGNDRVIFRGESNIIGTSN